MDSKERKKEIKVEGNCIHQNLTGHFHRRGELLNKIYNANV